MIEVLNNAKCLVAILALLGDESGKIVFREPAFRFGLDAAWNGLTVEMFFHNSPDSAILKVHQPKPGDTYKPPPKEISKTELLAQYGYVIALLAMLGSETGTMTLRHDSFKKGFERFKDGYGCKISGQENNPKITLTMKKLADHRVGEDEVVFGDKK